MDDRSGYVLKKSLGGDWTKTQGAAIYFDCTSIGLMERNNTKQGGREREREREEKVEGNGRSV